MRRNQILLILLLSALPLLWYRPGFLIGKGDEYPYSLNAKGFTNDLYMWSSNNAGGPSAIPAYSLYGFMWFLSQSVILDIGLWQIILRCIWLGGAALSMFFLSKTVYPKHKLAPAISSIFYVFNFLAMSILLNPGMMWTWAFLPLLMAFLIKTLTEKEKTSRNSIFFGLGFTIVASASSLNVALDVIIVTSLAAVLFYCAVERKTSLGRLLKTTVTLLAITFLLSTWWMVPTLNYYVQSRSTQLQQDVNVQSWSWTHVRGSFLNIFWLNGAWGWRPEYFTYYYSYSNNPLLILFLFIPVLLAATALLFRDDKWRLNAYLMLIVLLFIFLAKGLHEPLSSVNLFLYNNIPYMNMFREPFSKFVLALMPFLSLLVGYGADKISQIFKSYRVRGRDLHSKLVAAGIILVFVTSAFPILINPLETKTELIPFSTYVRLPDYWYEASEWLNSKPGDFRILVTPFEDSNMAPYSWGYYGADAFMERLITKPMLSPYRAYSYMVNPDFVQLMNLFDDMIKNRRIVEFESALSLLNVKYILQRNDLDYEYIALNNRNIMNPEKMRDFLSADPNIVLAKSVGKLDIYEFTETQPYIHVLESKPPQYYRIAIVNTTVSATDWTFDSQEQLSEWNQTTPEGQFGATCKLRLENSELVFELWNSTWGWKTINSPFVPAKYGTKNDIELSIRGENASNVHIKIFEYDINKQITHTEYVYFVGDGTFDKRLVRMNYDVKNESSIWLQILIWNGHETDKPFPNIIRIDDVKIQNYITEFNVTNIHYALNQLTEQSAKITEYKKVSPTETMVKADASGPFIIAINEAYNPYWKAYVNGEAYDPIPIFSVMNGFQINQTGQLNIIIEYEPQVWFFVGSAISVVASLACLAYLTYDYTKNRLFWKRIKSMLHRKHVEGEPTKPRPL